jgi:hypothetical protein
VLERTAQIGSSVRETAPYGATLSSHDAEQLPASGHPLELVLAAVIELDP